MWSAQRGVGGICLSLSPVLGAHQGQAGWVWVQGLVQGVLQGARAAVGLW